MSEAEQRHSTPVFERSDAKLHTRELLEAQAKLKSAEYSWKDLGKLLEAEAYVTQDIALAEYQEEVRSDKRGADHTRDETDALAHNWMAASKIARKAAENGVTSLANDEVTLLARAAGVMYAEHIFPEVMEGNVDNQNLGLNTMLDELNALSIDSLDSTLNVILYRPPQYIPDSLELTHTNFDRSTKSDTPLEEQDFKGRLTSLSQDKGLRALAAAYGGKVHILSGDSRGDSTRGWQRDLYLTADGGFIEGTGSSTGLEESSINKEFAPKDDGSFVAKDGTELFSDRILNGNNYPDYTRTPAKITHGVASYFSGHIATQLPFNLGIEEARARISHGTAASFDEWVPKHDALIDNQKK